MQQLILILHVLVAICIVALILVQHGKGADMGASFGAGSSNTMFGSAGPTSFLMKLTAILAAIFFITSISLSYITAREKKQASISALPSMQQPVNTHSSPAGLPSFSKDETVPQPKQQ